VNCLKTEIFGLFDKEIAELISPLGLEKYRAKQIVEWMYQRGVNNFADMTNLPLDKRVLLAERYVISRPTVQAVQQSSDGKTSKCLLVFHDGAAAETVLMRQPYGNSVCVSTQVGCGMGCVFCASTLHGVVRNLSGGEILAQVLHINTLLSNENSAVSNIVIMGSGEPLANYENVLRFIHLCHEKYCFNLSYRNITLSTSGIVPAIDRLAAECIPVTLSISLHAPNSEIRSQIMPINDRYPLDTVIAAGDRYAAQTGRRVTYEYTVIAGLNDKPEHAKQLAGLLKGRLANINLIPVNSVPERGLLRPDSRQITQFEQILRSYKINVTVRKEMGADIQAACGQLRNKSLINRQQ